MSAMKMNAFNHVFSAITLPDDIAGTDGRGLRPSKVLEQAFDAHRRLVMESLQYLSRRDNQC